ncbi:L,D-transpeptidase [Sporichthya polymorpha]|uniref:L,D-transpeptidase n=1 Tax=Sporichthya polymorpha TaxID=35751 RepID=UPI000382A7E5|nr:L,D-transpeptidase [Sporichthya polymorpha]
MASKSLRATLAGALCTTLLGAGLVTASPAEAKRAMPRTCYTGKIICVDKSKRVVRLVNNGKISVRLDARFGSSRTPTRNGMFRVYWKSRNHVSSLYGSAMPFSLFFSGGQAIHYSSDFARRGYSGASHGCVNTRDYSRMRKLFDRTPTGTRVYIYW